MLAYSRCCRILSVVCVGALLVSTAWAQTLPTAYIGTSWDGSPIPDVDKPNPANLSDATCWLASASNILAAAGYGSGGSPQLCAQNIYNQLTTAYGTTTGGAPDQAISYWLAWYGKNPNSPEYNASLAYTDVTAEYRDLGPVDYTFLKNELHNGQYVGVQFNNPAHAMTLVGWDDSLNQSIWHDSDRTIGAGGDDPYLNAFTASPVDWDLLDVNTTATYLDHANGYVTFCPGLNKDPDFMENYDVAWAPGPTGPMAREAGLMVGIYEPVLGWQAPWVDPMNPSATYYPFHIGNELNLFKQKHVELLVDFYGRDANYANEDILLRYFDETETEVVVQPTSVQLSADNGQVLFTWELDIQPAWEEILFPNYAEYNMLEGSVASWDVATLCVPEPSVLGLLFVAGLFGIGLKMSHRRRST